MTIMEAIEKDFVIIDKTAGEFMAKLSGTDIYKDIVLSAELAGLLLLRASNINLSALDPGASLLGAVADETYEQIQHFIFIWSQSNGLDPTGIDDVEIPEEYKEYMPSVTQFEQPFYEVCKQDKICTEYYPFVAVLSALKLVLAGDELALLDAKTGLAMIFYHVICGSKTVPMR